MHLQGLLKGAPTSHCHDILTELREGTRGGLSVLRGGEVGLAPRSCATACDIYVKGSGRFHMKIFTPDLKQNICTQKWEN